MKNIKVAGATINQTPLDWKGNTSRILAAIKQARLEQVQILCLPEMCITGYGCEDHFHSSSVQKRALEALWEIATASSYIIVSVGLPVLWRNTLFNCAALIVDGGVIGFAPKKHLAGDGLHYEPRWFKEWPAGVMDYLNAGFLGGSEAGTTPIGDILFHIGDLRIGFEICEDAWVANRPGANLAEHGVDVILNPSASHFAFDKFKTRERFVIEGSRAFGATYIYANLLGNEAGRAIYDGGVLIAAGGNLLASGPRFSYQDFVLTTAVVNVDATRMSQARTASFRPAFDRGNNVYEAYDYAEEETPTVHSGKQASWEHSDYLKCEEFTRATALALFDYCRKSSSGGFVISLSGGADSAACTVLPLRMVELASAELKFDEMCFRLLAKKFSSKTLLMRELLTCVYQPTENSGTITRDAAAAVANEVGASFYIHDVEAQFKQYVNGVEGCLGRAITWQRDDLALQNIQARVRAPGIWMFANIEGKLLIATSNRSEAAVGYCTMDGDTAGSISPIAGIDKAFLRHWLVFQEEEGGIGSSPLKSLSMVNVQDPTAELRPKESKQTDEKDLMPYPVLDFIEGCAIRDKMDPTECYRRLRSNFGEKHYSNADLETWVTRFFRLWCRNQWKRERYAPSFHVDDKNLDPRSWCRFPILSGGFEEELRKLHEYVQFGAKK